jgi:hypothetical protein
MFYLHSVYYNSICSIYTVGGCCLEFLVSGADGVTDDKLTASSMQNNDLDHGPARARLDTPDRWPYAGAWTAGTHNADQYVQVSGLRGPMTQTKTYRWVRPVTVYCGLCN